ncbi:MAG: isochorismatase family protein [Bacteroidetes bacterium]|nr:isochorismatase family protein [Bacteroidota bacterium]
MITAIDPRTALVLIDLQKGIAGRNFPTPVDPVIDHAVQLVDAFHKAGLPVVIVNVNPGNAPWLKSRKEPSSAPAAPPVPNATEIIPQIKAAPGDIFITKRTWGAFFETGLHEKLKERNITGIVLCGIATSIGVEGTARQASELGYNISFATDAMTDMSVDAHRHSISYIFPRIGESGSTADIIAKMRE